MKKVCLLFFLFIFIPASFTAAQKVVPDFIAEQIDGNGIKFRLSEHTGSWVALVFLCSASSELDSQQVLGYAGQMDRLLWQQGILPVIFRSDDKTTASAWFQSLPSQSFPVFRDPGGKLADNLGLPRGLSFQGAPVHYPACVLVDPQGREAWRRVGKNAADRITAEELLIQVDAIKTRIAAETAKKQQGDEKMLTTESGLRYNDIVEGTGPSPKAGQKVKVHYTGWLTNGKKFDSSLDRRVPFEFRIGRGEVIAGWDEGVMTMKVGGKRKLWIPPDLGYGVNGAGDVIPPNAELVFEVELLGIE